MHNSHPSARWNEYDRYRLRFWFEWMADTAFWPGNQAAYARFGVGSIAPEDLPLSPETAQRVHELAAWHDSSLNWEYPPDPGPWRQDECDRFNVAVKELHATVVRELGEAFEVVNLVREAREDPDLDAYLRDPNGFRRSQRRKGRRTPS